jgi:alcohol oxidase
VYEKQREAARNVQIYRGDVMARHARSSEQSAAGYNTNATYDRTPSGASVKKDLEYSLKDDHAMEQWARETVGVCWHFLCTCKMALREDHGVVDERLSFYGVQGLKVADMSIAPKMVSANTYNTAVMIGKKASDIFIEDLGLKK